MNDTPVNTERKVYPETHSKGYQLPVQGYTYNDHQLGNSDTLFMRKLGSRGHQKQRKGRITITNYFLSASICILGWKTHVTST